MLCQSLLSPGACHAQGMPDVVVEAHVHDDATNDDDALQKLRHVQVLQFHLRVKFQVSRLQARRQAAQGSQEGKTFQPKRWHRVGGTKDCTGDQRKLQSHHTGCPRHLMLFEAACNVLHDTD